MKIFFPIVGILSMMDFKIGGFKPGLFVGN